MAKKDAGEEREIQGIMIIIAELKVKTYRMSHRSQLSESPNKIEKR